MKIRIIRKERRTFLLFQEEDIILPLRMNQMALLNGEKIKNQISYAHICGKMMLDIYILLRIENFFALVHMQKAVCSCERAP